MDLPNSTHPATPAAPQPMAYVYGCVGSCGVLCNLFILGVLFSDRNFLSQSANMAGMALSHLLCASSIGAAGLYRVINASILNHPCTTGTCLSRIYPVMFPLAFQSMGLMLVIVGLERLSVFVFPHWYRGQWTNARNWRLIGLVYAVVGASCCVGVYEASVQPDLTMACAFAYTFGMNYTMFSSCVSAIGGVLAALLTVLGLVRGTARVKMLPLLSGEAGRYRRQLRLTRSMLSVAICDVCLVVFPNVLYIVSLVHADFNMTIFGITVTNFTNVTYCVNSVVTVFAYMTFHRQFRERALKLVRCHKSASFGSQVG